MTIEALWYKDGMQKGKRLSASDQKDKAIPIRLALGFTLGQAGYRSCGNMDDTTTWYWPRSTGRWWKLPKELEAAVFDVRSTALDMALRIHQGRASTSQVATILRRMLAQAGGVTLTIDTRVSETIFPPGKRLSALAQHRNNCPENEIEGIDWLMIELALPTGAQKARKR